MPTLRNISFQFGKRVTVHISTKLEYRCCSVMLSPIITTTSPSLKKKSAALAGAEADTAITTRHKRTSNDMRGHSFKVRRHEGFLDFRIVWILSRPHRQNN